MCGIAGIYSYSDSAPTVDIDELLLIREAMRARGPDDAGVWVAPDGQACLAHRRLSIIDLSNRARQPMVSADGSLIVSYNGEIYNYVELADELRGQGYVFRTSSDTEVLLHLYQRDGERMVDRLRGMFAFAIWDVRERKLFLARDPNGIKPLYYSDTDGVFRFASQAKALIAGGALPTDEDPAGWVGFFLFGSVPEPFTTWAAIRSLPAGTHLTVSSDRVPDPSRYSAVADAYLQEPREQMTSDEVAARYRDALEDSVAHHMVSDVAVGCFLSAGIDSCALLAMMSRVSAGPIQSVTLGFEEFSNSENDEVGLARDIASRYGANHAVRWVGRSDFEAALPRILRAMDQPTIDGVNTWFVSMAARELGLKVAISGLGGDELFGGYASFDKLPKWAPSLAMAAAVPGLGSLVRHGVTSLQRMIPMGNPKIGGLVEYGGDISRLYFLFRGLYMPWELEDFLDPDFVKKGLERLNLGALIDQALRPKPASSFGQVATLESSLYMRNQLLRDCDWASMDHSLEVRTPLVDSALLRMIASLPRRPGKSDLASAPLGGLPPELTRRRKTGFATPVSTWLSNAASDLPKNSGPIKKPLTAKGSRQVAQHISQLWRAS